MRIRLAPLRSRLPSQLMGTGPSGVQGGKGHLQGQAPIRIMITPPSGPDAPTTPNPGGQKQIPPPQHAAQSMNHYQIFEPAPGVYTSQFDDKGFTSQLEKSFQAQLEKSGFHTAVDRPFQSAQLDKGFSDKGYSFALNQQPPMGAPAGWTAPVYQQPQPNPPTPKAQVGHGLALVITHGEVVSQSSQASDRNLHLNANVRATRVARLATPDNNADE